MEQANDNVAAPEEAELHAYIDGQLSPERRAEVEAYLAAHPGETARLSDYRAINLALHRLYDSHSILPRGIAGMADRLEQAMKRQWRWQQLRRGAAAAAFLVMGSTLAFWGFERYAPPDEPWSGFMRDATQAHLLFADQYELVSQAEQGEAGQLMAMLSKQAGAGAARPDLSNMGFSLVSVRMLPTSNGPSAQLLYRDRSDAPITVFVAPTTRKGEQTFSYAKEGEISLLYWQRNGLFYALAGRLEQQRLLALAALIDHQIGGEALPTQTSSSGSGEGKPKAVLEVSGSVSSSASPDSKQLSPAASPQKAGGVEKAVAKEPAESRSAAPATGTAGDAKPKPEAPKAPSLEAEQPAET